MNGTNWKDFVDSIREAGGYRKRIKRYTKDRNQMLDAGGQPNTPPFTQKMGSHVTFDKQIEEEVEIDSFEPHDTLEPRLWGDAEELNSRASSKLLKIAQDFIDSLPIETDIKDIKLTGSLANYNWSNYSDIDLHIVVDFLDIDENKELVKSLFDNARMRWNNTHHIKIKGYDVEVYIEDVEERHVSSGVYSVLDQEWLRRPKRYESEIDFSSARRKAEDLEFQANIIDNLITIRKFKVAFKNIERLKTKIKNMRRAGLESAKQEFSVENIAFKILRRNGTLEKLSDLKTQLYDTMMSMKEE